MNTEIHGADLSQLVKQVLNGEEIILEEHGQPVAKIVSINKSLSCKEPRKLGLSPDIEMSEDFDEWPDNFAFPFGKMNIGTSCSTLMS